MNLSQKHITRLLVPFILFNAKIIFKITRFDFVTFRKKLFLYVKLLWWLWLHIVMRIAIM